MRTLQIINVKWYNATAWYAIYLAHTLKKLGHPSAIVISPDSPARAYAKNLGLDVYEMPLNSHKLRDILMCNKQINELCQEFKPDIVNCHRGEAFFLWAFKKKKLGYTLVRTRGDQRLPSTDFFNRYLHNVCSDAVIATNTKMKQYFLTKMRTPIAKMHTILGGVDTTQFYPDREKRKFTREEFSFSENDIVIGIVGRFDAVKGFQESFQAFSGLFQNTQYVASLKEEGAKKLHLMVIGRDCDFTLDDLKSMAQACNIPKEYVYFLKNPPDMNMYMNMFDVGLIASISSETIARVAFEMIACNVPLISSDVGVLPDIVPSNNVYHFDDLGKLTELFLNVRDEKYRQETLATLRQRLHAELQNGSHDPENLYGWTLEAFTQKTLNVYEKCLAKR